MATLNVTLTLASTDLTSDALSMTVTDSLTTGQYAAGISRTTVTNVGANNIIQPRTDGQTYYLYVKHTGTSDGSAATTETLNIELTGDVVFGKLAAGEFCFIPLGGHSLGAQLQSSSGTIVAEYAYFVKG
jgi:hypothetical protein|tara:strand:- start:1001 stop:1390 length:390 start_codon:yes stop_codon:yes gene_type:complete